MEVKDNFIKWVIGKVMTSVPIHLSSGIITRSSIDPSLLNIEIDKHGIQILNYSYKIKYNASAPNPNLYLSELDEPERALAIMWPSKAQLYSEYVTKYNISEIDMTIIRDILSCFNLVLPYVKMPDIEYIPMNIYIKKRANYRNHVCKNISIKFMSNVLKERYKLVVIPREIRDLFRNISMNFETLKGILIFDDVTGFYCYKIEDVNIPVLCKHEYMYYDGMNALDISIKCYVRGKCKYCGSDLIAYNEQLKELLPDKVYEFVHKFVASMKLEFTGMELFHFISMHLYDVIETGGIIRSSQNYERNAIAFGGIYLLKLHEIMLADKIYFDSSFENLKLKITEACNLIGWSNVNIASIMKTEKYFKNIRSIIDRLNSLNKIIKKEDYDMHPLSTMFNIEKVILDPATKFIELTSNTKLQETYLDNPNNIKIINDTLQFVKMSLYKLLSIHDILKLIKLKYVLKPVDIKNEDLSDAGKMFYDKIYKIYCPNNLIHEFENKKCKHCSMKSDWSNKDTIFEKFKFNILNSYLQLPSIIKIKYDVSTRNDIIKNIKAIKSDAIELLKIEDYSLKQLMSKAMNTYNNKVFSLISTILILGEHDNINTAEFIKLALGYILEKNIVSPETLLFKLKCIYLGNFNSNILLIR
jgi:hypothetical protein